MSLLENTAVVKPKRLQPGDTVGIVSPSWGGPHKFPHVFDLGLKNLRERFGVRVQELPTARMGAAELHGNPKLRAEDINRAFADPEISAIIASIGGDDSVRILPYLDLDTILANPKILMGFSDSTTLTSYLNQKGLVTFNGPSILAGFAQMKHLPDAFTAHVRSILMEPASALRYEPYTHWANEYLDWATPGYDGETSELVPHEGWRWLQGSTRIEGRLFGGCIDVFEFMKSTKFWPADNFWYGRILFFETSEDKPTTSNVKYMLRNYGSMGALDKIAGLLFGRARSYTPEEKEDLYKVLVSVVGDEFGRPDLPIVANMDFGHSDPQFVMPLGIKTEIDCERRTVTLLEPAVT